MKCFCCTISISEKTFNRTFHICVCNLRRRGFFLAVNGHIPQYNVDTTVRDFLPFEGRFPSASDQGHASGRTCQNSVTWQLSQQEEWRGQWADSHHLSGLQLGSLDTHLSHTGLPLQTEMFKMTMQKSYTYNYTMYIPNSIIMCLLICSCTCQMKPSFVLVTFNNKHGRNVTHSSPRPV